MSVMRSTSAVSRGAEFARTVAKAANLDPVAEQPLTNRRKPLL
jgi:hypothetical protein